MWFPRVELRLQLLAPQLLFRLREAPKLRRSVTLATHTGRDPRTAPRFKGPDLEAMTRLRTLAQKRGADEAVLLSAEGWVAEGSTTSLAWWRGDALCVPSNDIERVDGVTIRSVITLATALGVDVLYETVTPGELQGLEVWALNALHGIRIVTAWIDGPATAELPGRLATWQARLDALRKPLPSGLA
jgi:branched-subunit amino acid aminotransferase/4-amino-4-deoxychorismate lyase